jgi:uncharacterized protein (TIGR00255 family)
MIKSMTGYGKAEAEIGGKKITVEVRSLNSKQLDLSMRIPAIYRPAEYAIRTEAAKRLGRGKVDVFIGYEAVEGAVVGSINRAAFSGYCNQLQNLMSANKLVWEPGLTDALIVPAILRLPEVVRSDAEEIADDELAALKRTAVEAMDNLDRFREQEGAVLLADLLGRVETIEQLKNSVTPYEAPRVELVKNRIREHIESLQIPVDSNRLEQEMIFYVEKFDITEEKVRLQNHLDYFREVARTEANPGRKLGFIAQEIGREINTTGSKANDVDIQRLVVRMKDELEKIKEQLLNLL